MSLSLYKKILIITGFIFFTSNLNAEEFLTLFLPAESISMGESYAVGNKGINSCWLNPAGLNKLMANQYSIGGSTFPGELTLVTGSAVINSPIGNLGFGMGWLGSGSEYYENSQGERTGEMLDFNKYLFSIGYGKKLWDVPTGVNLKLVHSTLGFDNKLLIFMDIGVMLNFMKFDIGFMLRNIGISSYDSGNWGELRTAVSRQIISAKKINLKILSDLFYSSVEGIGFNIGSEIELFNIVAIRAGFSPNKFNKFHLGTGVRFNISGWNIQLDYGLNPSFEGLALSHFAQITIHSKKEEIKLKNEIYLNKAEDYIKSNAYEKAEKEINKVSKTSPGNEKAKEMKVIIQNEKNKIKAKSHLREAETYIKLKDYVNAKKELESVIKLTPGNKEAYYELGKIYYDQDDYIKSLENIKKSLSIDQDYQEAKAIEEMILIKIENEKPEWLEEDSFYTENTIVFEDFTKETIISKFIASTGKFERIIEENIQYGRWEIDTNKKTNCLKTSIRLPDLLNYDGIILSVKSTNLSRINIILIVQETEKEQEWIIPLPDIKSNWQEVKIPFRYFQLPDEPGATINLNRITEIQFVITSEMPEYKKEGMRSNHLCIDKMIFYKR